MPEKRELSNEVFDPEIWAKVDAVFAHHKAQTARPGEIKNAGSVGEVKPLPFSRAQEETEIARPSSIPLLPALGILGVQVTREGYVIPKGTPSEDWRSDNPDNWPHN